MSVTSERLRSLLSYDATTGVFTWVDSRHSRRAKNAGHLHHTGYVVIRVDGREYGAHRLAWLYAFGAFPSVTIDHINRVRSDNRLCNLREATLVQNQANTSGRGGLCGHKGVRFDPRQGRRPYVARLMANGRNVYLGSFVTAEAAAEAHRKKSIEIFGEFAGC